MKKLLIELQQYFRRIRVGQGGRIDGSSRLVKLARDECKFCENYSGSERCVIFQIELLGKSQRLLYKTTLKKWLPPFGDEVSESDRDRIATKVKIFWEAQGYWVVLK